MPRAVIAILALIPAVAAGEVPAWFAGNGKDPYVVFSAWQNLSTRDAALAVEAGWGTVGGVVRDEAGRPVAGCPISASHGGPPGGSFHVSLATDAEGRFLVYGTTERPKTDAEHTAERVAEERERAGESEQERLLRMLRLAEECGPKGYHVRVAPGYPISQIGRRFAYEKKAWRECRVDSVEEAAPGQFYCVLTCNGESTFDAEAFEAFVREDAARPVRFAREEPWRRPPEPPREKGQGPVTNYPVRVIGRDGGPVEDARVTFSAGRGGNHQTVATDADGFATLEEYRPSTREPSVDDEIRRSVLIDVKDGPVGPVDIELQAETLNVIRVPEAATVRGRVLDHFGGYPFHGVSYVNPPRAAFATELAFGGGARFEFSRVMPGQPFRVTYAPEGAFHASPCHSITNQCLPAASEVITLDPGEVRDGIELVVRPAAAVRGVVVDEAGSEAPAETVIRLLERDRDWGLRIGARGVIHSHPEPPSGPRFGLFGRGTEPIRFLVECRGFRTVTTDPIALEPGELRFVKIVLPSADSTREQAHANPP